MPGEFELIAWIRERVRTEPNLLVGIGDDAAVLRTPEAGDLLFAVDTLVEGVHFERKTSTPREVGRKALGVNLSDVAAMAGRPLAAVVSLVVPRNERDEYVHELLDGLRLMADANGTLLVGGDTNTGNGPLSISVTVLGVTTGNGAVRRNGARPGDWLFVTGELGGSLRGQHFWFQPRVEEARALHEAVGLHAMIDVSDGLVSDLGHVLDESAAGAVLRAEAIPVSQDALAAGDGKHLQHALHDGEDFELLFAVSPADGERLLANPIVDVRLSHVGEVVEERGCWLEDEAGRRTPLERSGWQHGFGE